MTAIIEENEVLVLLYLMERLWVLKENNIISAQEFDAKKAEIMSQISVLFANPIYADEPVESIDNENPESEGYVIAEEYNSPHKGDTVQLGGKQSNNSRKIVGAMLCIVATIVLLITAVRYPTRIAALSELADEYRESGLTSYRLAQENPGLSSYFYNSAAINDFDSATEALGERRDTIVEACLLGGAGVVAGIAGIVCIKKKDS